MLKSCICVCNMRRWPLMCMNVMTWMCSLLGVCVCVSFEVHESLHGNFTINMFCTYINHIHWQLQWITLDYIGLLWITQALLDCSEPLVATGYHQVFTQDMSGRISRMNLIPVHACCAFCPKAWSVLCKAWWWDGRLSWGSSISQVIVGNAVQ